VKKMEKPIVSICIPTYNRRKILIDCIDSIVKQEEFISNRVELVVMDNCSDDGTCDVCLEYERKYTNFVYARNEVNMDDRRFPLLLSLASGKLRKLSNDRVIYTSGSLKYLCEMAQKYYDKKVHIYWGNGLKNCWHGQKAYSFSKFVEKASYMLTWMSSFSIWDYECENICNDTKDTELLLWQVRKSLDIAKKMERTIICNKKIMKDVAPPKKDISYGLVNVFYYNFLEILGRYVDDNYLKMSVIQKVEKDILYHFFSVICFEYETSDSNLIFNNEEKITIKVEEIYKNKSYWHNYLMYYWIKKRMLLARQNVRNYLRRLGKDDK